MILHFLRRKSNIIEMCLCFQEEWLIVDTTNWKVP
jgi:hypothetical protein